MTKWLLSLTLMLAAQSSFAKVQKADDELVGKIYQTLVTLAQSDKIEMVGDVHRHEKLKDILEEASSFVYDALLALTGSQAEEKERIVKDLSMTCEVAASKSSAKCELIIQYKPMGETAILFEAILENDGNKISILRNQVEVARGS
jgi:hypothetical protein